MVILLHFQLGKKERELPLRKLYGNTTNINVQSIKEEVMYNIINRKTGEVLKSFTSMSTAYLWLKCWDGYPNICSVVKLNK